MRPVSELYNRHLGSDIYIVGTGPSLRVFPSSFLEGRLTIGLNMAWKLVPVIYGVTIHPELNIPEFMVGEQPHSTITWITKREKAKGVLTEEQFRYADEQFYFFEADHQPNSQPSEQPSDAGRVLEWVRAPTGNKLYQWSSISQTAMNLAANMGAKNIILVGCDNCALTDNHHAHQQHVRWKGVTPDARYYQYYRGLAEVRSVLRERQVNVISLHPFLGLSSLEEDFLQLCGELGVETHIHNPEILSPPTTVSYLKRLRATLQRIGKRPENI